MASSFETIRAMSFKLDPQYEFETSGRAEDLRLMLINVVVEIELLLIQGTDIILRVIACSVEDDYCSTGFGSD
jgi:hypothetical protein